MTQNVDWCTNLFSIVIIPLSFVWVAIRFPVIFLGITPHTEAHPGGHLDPFIYYLLPANSALVRNTGVDIQYFPLWILIGVIVLQMVIPSSSRRLEPIFDIGINLLISAGVLWLWVIINSPTVALLTEWLPQIVVYTPLLGLILVPFQRILWHNYRKRKNDDASKEYSEASH